MREKPRNILTFEAPSQTDEAARASGQHRFGPFRMGVSIVRFNPDSAAENAGMQKGDVIIEYDGVGNLTIESLPALTTKPRPEGTSIPVAFLRRGLKHSVTLPAGSLGISAINVRRHGRSNKQQADSAHGSSNERLVQFIKSELAARTSKTTLRRTLVENGWDKTEAARLVDHVADQILTDPNYVRTTQFRMIILLAAVLLLRICGVAFDSYSSVKDAFTANWYFFAVFACLLLLWYQWHKRVKSLAPKTQELERRVNSFVPTKGKLNITELSRSWTDIPSYIRERPTYIGVGLSVIALMMCLAAFAVVVVYAIVYG